MPERGSTSAGRDARIWQDLVEVLRETFEEPDLPITRTTTADDIVNWDSLSNVELMVALERRFRVRFSTGEMAGLRNVGELADVIIARAPDGAR